MPDSPSIVSPQIIFGSPSTGAGCDSLRVALGKFNEHSHGEVSNTNFFTYPLVLGSIVTTVSDESSDSLFPAGTTLTAYSPKTLTFSSAAIKNSTNGVLKIGNLTLTNLVAETGNLSATSANRSGVVTSETSENYNLYNITGKVSALAPTTYPLLLSAYRGIKLVRFSYKLVTGIAQVKLTTESRVIHELNITEGLATTNYVDFSTNSLVDSSVKANKDLNLEFSAISGLAELYYTAYYVNTYG